MLDKYEISDDKDKRIKRKVEEKKQKKNYRN